MGLRLSRRWWDQTSLDILWIRGGHAAAEGGGGWGGIQGHRNIRERERKGRIGKDGRRDTEMTRKTIDDVIGYRILYETRVMYE